MAVTFFKDKDRFYIDAASVKTLARLLGTNEVTVYSARPTEERPPKTVTKQLEAVKGVTKQLEAVKGVNKQKGAALRNRDVWIRDDAGRIIGVKDFY